METALGQENVVLVEPTMAGEDFGYYSLGDKIPLSLFWLGTVDPAKVEKSRKEGTQLPPLHSSLFAPLPEPTIRTGIKATTSVVLDLMKK
jgi:hippurate hydrolase